MSLLAEPKLPPVPTAPHSRVKHIFYTAPYIKMMFDDILESHPECELLESDVIVNSLSAVYILGLKHSPSFWKIDSAQDLSTDHEEMVVRLQHLRMTRGKYKGRHQWDHFLAFLHELTGEHLPSRKSPAPLVGPEADSQIRFAIAVLALKLYEAPPPVAPPPIATRPRRIGGRLTRRSKSEP